MNSKDLVTGENYFHLSRNLILQYLGTSPNFQFCGRIHMLKFRVYNKNQTYCAEYNDLILSSLFLAPKLHKILYGLTE